MSMRPSSVPGRLRRIATTTALLVGSLALPVGGQAEEPDAPLTLYSGRSESLVGPILERFSAVSGIGVDARFGDTAELAALLLEEGERSPADLFFAQDAGALGAVADGDLLAPLPDDLVARVPEAFRDASSRWVGVSGRARTVAHTTTEELGLPDSILGFTDPAWSGRIGWAPSNGSFQAFVTALRARYGEAATREWLQGVLANDPVAYPSNSSAVEGVAAGEVDVALVNHYYLLQLQEEHGEAYPVAQHFFEGGDLGSLVNVAGIGRLDSSDQPDAAAAFIDFMLSAEAQRYFAETTFEYPLIDGVAADPRLPSLASLDVPEIELADLADLKGTVELLRDVGAID